jgi:hypothetical protein
VGEARETLANISKICEILKFSPTKALREWIEEENYFFRRTKYEDQLLKYINENPEFIQPEDRFNEVISAKHFFIGILKGPFFAFLIASIGIYRGLMVKDDTQSIGINTTKSVVESIFAVIVCDAIFSIVFTNLGI